MSLEKFREWLNTSQSARGIVPHCDPSILHAPGECRYCDAADDWQAYREVARINFTGHDDPDKVPCPSLHFRSAEKRDAWYGNTARP